jgi:hypothetical protein
MGSNLSNNLNFVWAILALDFTWHHHNTGMFQQLLPGVVPQPIYFYLIFIYLILFIFILCIVLYYIFVSDLISCTSQNKTHFRKYILFLMVVLPPQRSIFSFTKET